MPDRDAAVIVAAFGLPADLLHVPPGRIEVEVEMQVDVDVELLREVENPLEMRVRIGVHIGTAADRLAAVAQRRDQQFLGPGIVGQALLRKHADREIERPGIVALQRLDRLVAAQANARIDLDMGAHPRGAMHDGPLDHFCTTRVDILHREVALHGRDRGDGVGHTAMVVPAAAEQAGLVEVNMRVDKAGQGKPAADIDLGCLAGKPRLNSDDTPAGDADVDRDGRGPGSGVAEDQVEGGFRVHRAAGWRNPQPSGTAFPGQLQIVCSLEAGLSKIYACNLVTRL